MLMRLASLEGQEKKAAAKLQEDERDADLAYRRRELSDGGRDESSRSRSRLA